MRGRSGLDLDDLRVLARRTEQARVLLGAHLTRRVAPPRRPPWWVYGRPAAGERDIDGQRRWVASRMEANLWRLFCYQRDRLRMWREVTFQPAALDFTRPRPALRLPEIRHGTTRYRPDFRLVDPEGAVVYVEARPYLDRLARIRLARARRYFPECGFRVITTREYQEFAQTWGRVIAEWE